MLMFASPSFAGGSWGVLFQKFREASLCVASPEAFCFSFHTEKCRRPGVGAHVYAGREGRDSSVRVAAPRLGTPAAETHLLSSALPRRSGKHDVLCKAMRHGASTLKFRHRCGSKTAAAPQSGCQANAHSPEGHEPESLRWCSDACDWGGREGVRGGRRRIL